MAVFRLNIACRPNTYAWQYDATGNRTQSPFNGAIYPYAIDPASNRHKGIVMNGNVIGLDIDKAGNQKSLLTPTTSFVYGPTGRIEGGFSSEHLAWRVFQQARLHWAQNLLCLTHDLIRTDHH